MSEQINIKSVFNESTYKILHNNSWVLWPIRYPYLSQSNKNRKQIDMKELSWFYWEDDLIIYIHVPFCYQKCSFCSYHWSNNIYTYWSERYTDLLIKELENFLLSKKSKNYVQVVAFWWWTPSILKDKDLERLLKYIRDNFILDENSQFSIETTPNLLSKSKIKVLKNAWFDRVSIWVETFDEQIIKNVKRKQNNAIVYNSFKNLKEEWIDLINIDLIYWLDDNYSVEDFLETNLPHILKLRPTTIDLYPLVWQKTLANISTKDISDNIVKIAKEINKHFDHRIVITNLTIWNWRWSWNPEKNHTNYCYYAYYWALYKNILPIWSWPRWNILVDWEQYFVYKFIWIKEYEEAVNNDWKIYTFYKLTKEQTIKSFFVKNLFTWINLKLFEYIFWDSKENLKILFKSIIKVKDFIKIEWRYVYLKHDFDKQLPFDAKDLIKNYFQLIYIYVYDLEDKIELNKFIKSKKNI